MKTFRSYQLAKEVYREAKKLPLKGEVRDQLHRAALSVCLNLAEGTDRATAKDRARFFSMALGSIREVQAIVAIEQLTSLESVTDHLGASVYKLARACRPA